jgi:hypothetical protein
MNDTLAHILNRIEKQRYQLAIKGDENVSEFNLHQVTPPFPVVVKAHRVSRLPTAPDGGDAFLVEHFTRSGDGVTWVAHVLDHRFASDEGPMRRSMAAWEYEVISTVPKRYENGPADLMRAEIVTRI